MVAFKKMWNDVNCILSNDEINDVNIVETFKSGFVVKDEGNTHFVTKDDFVDFWCNMLFFQKVDKDDISKKGEERQKYVYNIIKNLPYITESNGCLNLTE